jgi:hypothetical protein
MRVSHSYISYVALKTTCQDLTIYEVRWWSCVSFCTPQGDGIFPTMQHDDFLVNLLRIGQYSRGRFPQT